MNQNKLSISRLNKDSNERSLAEDLYLTAFPEIERHPIGELSDACNTGKCEWLIFKDNATFIGMAYMVVNDDIAFMKSVTTWTSASVAKDSTCATASTIPVSSNPPAMVPPSTTFCPPVPTSAQPAGRRSSPTTPWNHTWTIFTRLNERPAI